jgi:hypothetical protein
MGLAGRQKQLFFGTKLAASAPKSIAKHHKGYWGKG